MDRSITSGMTGRCRDVCHSRQSNMIVMEVHGHILKELSNIVQIIEDCAKVVNSLLDVQLRYNM